MPECRYCGRSVADEAALRDHLLTEHDAELGPIDRRRITTEEPSLGERVPVALLAVIGIAVAVVGGVLVMAGGTGGGGDGPSAVGSVHEHGVLVMVVNGERVDFSNPRYQYPNRGSDAFHFEGGNGRVYHVHARGVTLGYAMDTLGIDVTESTVTFEGTTYRDDDPGTSVAITVNGQPVDPTAVVLHGPTDAGRAADGDRVRIVVEQS